MRESEWERLKDLPFMFSSQNLPDTYFLNQSTENGEIFFGDFQIINWKSSWKYTTLKGRDKMDEKLFTLWQLTKGGAATGSVGGKSRPNNKKENERNEHRNLIIYSTENVHK